MRPIIGPLVPSRPAPKWSFIDVVTYYAYVVVDCELDER